MNGGTLGKRVIEIKLELWISSAQIWVSAL